MSAPTALIHDNHFEFGEYTLEAFGSRTGSRVGEVRRRCGDRTAGVH